MNLTKEQEEILNYDYKKGDSVIINAFAGTGKTFTLVQLARKFEQENPNIKCLYVVFNTNTKADANRKFSGTNVECRTTGSLVYNKYSKPYGKMNNLRLGDIKNALGIGWADCVILKRTVEKFIGSADMSLDAKHIPMDSRGTKDDKIMVYANKLWKMMVDVQCRNVPITFDGSIKLAQLNNFQFKDDDDGQPYDVVFFDECQDANPATLGIIANQKKMIKVFVGDKHQQIYQFRGSQNAINSVEGTKYFNLTTSFRFGSNIANVANVLLDVLGEGNEIEGFKSEDYICETDDSPYAFIARTNAQLFEHAIKAITDGKKIHYVGGVTGYRLEDIQDIYYLMNGQSVYIKNEYIKKTFKSAYMFKEYIEKTEDPEWKSIKKVVETYSNIPQLVDQIKKSNGSVQKGDVYLMTAHKSKGAEFERVKLGDDYIKFFDDAGKPKPIFQLQTEVAELNLLYVACTRAIKYLDVPLDFKRLLYSKGIEYTIPETLEDLLV